MFQSPPSVPTNYRAPLVHSHLLVLPLHLHPAYLRHTVPSPSPLDPPEKTPPLLFPLLSTPHPTLPLFPPQAPCQACRLICLF